MLVDVIDCHQYVFGILEDDLLFAPGVFELCLLLEVLDRQPAWSLDLSLQQEYLEHALVCSKNTLKSITSQVGRKRWIFSWILNFEEFVLSMSNRHFKSVLSGNQFTLESGDILESILPQIIEFNYHALLLLPLFFFAERSSSFVILHFCQSKERSLQAFDLYIA